jgi:serine/threonine-protein kinase
VADVVGNQLCFRMGLRERKLPPDSGAHSDQLVSLELLAKARKRVGKTLSGKYRLDRLLGVGGMASVYAATHLRNANCVAVKILHSELSVDRENVARFLREGYAANSVGHRGTVRVLDDDRAEDGSIFLVMELLEGETLDARSARTDSKLAVAEVVRIIRALLNVLAAAHANGIVHRDVKPENVFLTHDGEVKVLDFGIAQLRQTSSARTGAGTVVGSPAFMPPEQALGRTDQIDATSDVWAVGATAYLLLSGRLVHTGSTPAEMTVFAATRPAPALATVAPEVPAAIAQVIDRALAFRREDRWPSAQAMRDALTQARDATIGKPAREDDAQKVVLDSAAPPAPVVRWNHRAPGDVEREGQFHLGASTVAGVVSNSEARRVRVRQRRVVAGATAAGFLAVAMMIMATGMASTKGAVAASSGAVQQGVAIAASPVTSLPSAPPVPASTTTGSTPSVPVDNALPKAGPARTDGSPSQAGHAAPQAAVSGSPRAAGLGTAPSRAPVRTPKRDPLSPW